MRTINETGLVKYTITDFIENVFVPKPVKVLCWDTCGFLDIVRFVFRQEPIHTFDSIVAILNMVEGGQVLSVASELTIKEWNDNVDIVYDFVTDSFIKTTNYHYMASNAINKIKGMALSTSQLHGQGLEDELVDIAIRILNKTYFIKTDEVSNDAIVRLSNHQAPGGKKSKSEAKDCVIWETMLALSKGLINYPDKTKVPNTTKVFYTVNTDDFADKSKKPYQFQRVLLTEAAANSFLCCMTFTEVETVLKR